MILIKELRIRYYRSLKEITLNNINEFNVFSGKNDSGKSNILKALDIFFNNSSINFDEDYNKERLAIVRNSIKSKQLIDIRITFSPPKGYSTLPKLVTITKTWDRNGELLSTTDNLESLAKNTNFTPKDINLAKRSLYALLKKIRYMYVPGVRDEIYFSQLLQELQSALFEKEDRRKNSEDSVKETITAFNAYISKITTNLNEDFKKSSGIETNLSFPSELTLLFKRLLVGTKTGEHDIPLYLRGDGIRLWYIPVILNHIATISPKFFIWGFDEPENSCEYSLSSILANDFLTKYTKTAQIFVATHSFSFTSIDAGPCTVFRVYKEGELNTKAIDIKKISSQGNVLLDEIGFISINKSLKQVYDNLTLELNQIDKIKDELNSMKKPFLIFEGESDNILFSTAYQKLRNTSIEKGWHLCCHIKEDKKGSIGDGAQALNNFLYNHSGKFPTENLIIGVFDYDEKGVFEIKALGRVFDNISKEYSGRIVFRHKQKKNVFAITLVPPDDRTSIVDFKKEKYCYLSIELLLKDGDIPIVNREYPSRNDRSVFSFSGERITFAETVRNNSSSYDLSGFNNTIMLLEEILKRNDKSLGLPLK